MRLLLIVVLFSSCQYFQVEQLTDLKPNIDENFFEKGSKAEIKMIKCTPNYFVAELVPPRLNGNFEVEYTYHWEYFRTKDDATSREVSKLKNPKISPFKGSQVVCKFQGRRLDNGLKSYEKIAILQYN